MHDVHGAVSALAEALLLTDLALDDGGHAEIVVGGATPVGLVAVGRHHLEFVTPLKELGTSPGGGVLARLMTANYLGTGTGGARLALDPGRGEIVLCARLDVRDVEADALVRRFGDFLGVAAFWKSADGRAFAAGEADADLPASLETFSPNDFTLRA